VTATGLGSSHPALRRWVPSLVGLPSPVHERSGSGPQRPTGYKLMRSLPHAASRPSRGITSARSARANTSRPRTSRRAPPPSRPLRAASGGGLRPALTAAALARNRQPSAPAGKRLLTPQAPYKRMSARRREGYGGPARSARLSAAKAGSDIRDPASRFAHAGYSRARPNNRSALRWQILALSSAGRSSDSITAIVARM